MKKSLQVVAFVAALWMVILLAVQGVSHAFPRVPTKPTCTVEANKNPTTGRHGVLSQNPVLVHQRLGDYAQLYGDVTIDCRRNEAAVRRHNRIASFVVIEKWRPQYKKYFTYRYYAYNESWDWRQPRKVVFPAARIVCDGHGHYRVRAQAYTYEAGVHVGSYPSLIVGEASNHIATCVGTRHKSLGVVNNP